MKAAAHVYQRMRGWQHERQNFAFSFLQKCNILPEPGVTISTHTAVTTAVLVSTSQFSIDSVVLIQLCPKHAGTKI